MAVIKAVLRAGAVNMALGVSAGVLTAAAMFPLIRLDIDNGILTILVPVLLVVCWRVARDRRWCG